ncbi:hypothetical protein HDU90_003442 [Geranomyces variabilis]|nr:hypothetical protein HDU90_003442 [Geranomyces variabilis]
MDVPTTDDEDSLIQKIKVANMFATAMTTVAQQKREAAIALSEGCSKAIDAIYNHISNDPVQDRYSIFLDVPYTVELQKEVERLLCDAGWRMAKVHMRFVGGKKKCDVTLEWPNDMAARIRNEISSDSIWIL